MALKVSRKVIRDKVRIEYGIRNNAVPTDTDLNLIIQDSVNEFWETLTRAAPPHRFSKDYPLTVVAGQYSYDLDQLVPDYMSLQRLYYIEETTSSRWREIHQMPGHMRGHVEPPSVGAQCILRYTPTAPQFSDDDTIPLIESVAGWDRWLVVASCAVLARAEGREERERSYERERERLTVRIVGGIRAQAASGLEYITDVEERDAVYPFTAWNPITVYQLRDHYIDIFAQRVRW